MAQLEPLSSYLPARLRERFRERPNLWRALSNIGWLFGDQILRLIVGLFVGVLVARHLGPADFGTLNYSMAFVALLMPLALLGLDDIVIRDVIHDPQRRREILGTAFVLKTLSGTFAWALAIGVILIRSDDSSMPLLVGIVGAALFFQAFDTLRLWFQSQVQSKYAVLARNGSLLVVAAVRVGFVLANATIVAFAAAVAMESAVTAAGMVIAYWLSNQRTGAWAATVQTAARLIQSSWPLILSGFAVAVSLRADQIILGEMQGDDAVGVYAAAVRLSELWYFASTAVIQSIAPLVMKAKKTDPVAYRRRAQQLLSLMALLGYVVAVPVSLLSTRLIALLYGSEFAEAGPVLAVHIWAFMAVGIGGAQTVWLINEGRTGFAMLSTSLGAVVNVALNYFLIPRAGPLGAAIATVVSYSIPVVAVWAYRPTRPLGHMTLKALLLRQ